MYSTQTRYQQICRQVCIAFDCFGLLFKHASAAKVEHAVAHGNHKEGFDFEDDEWNDDDDEEEVAVVERNEFIKSREKQREVSKCQSVKVLKCKRA